MGKTEKNRGKAFEYWTAEYLTKLGWFAKRNPLSGSSKQVSDEIGRNDVRANIDNVHMFIECKKTSKSQITLHKKWFDHLQPVAIVNDRATLVVEPLVFAFQPEPGGKLEPVACLPLKQLSDLLKMASEADFSVVHNLLEEQKVDDG